MFDFAIIDAIDIFLVALMLYYTYRFMRDSKSLNVFIGILVFIIIWLFVSRVLEMRLLGDILDKLVGVGSLAILILFQDEIRKFLNNLGGQNRIKNFLKIFSSESKKEKTDREYVMPIVMACQNMSRARMGALIVIERNSNLDNIIMTGDTIDANINQRLIENIFFKNSPLHDGAMVISKKRVTAAACILPVAHDNDIPKALGLRHRAGLGISQKSDCLAIIVSEETGGISIAQNGNFSMRLSAEELEIRLSEALKEK